MGNDDVHSFIHLRKVIRHLPPAGTILEKIKAWASWS